MRFSTVLLSKSVEHFRLVVVGGGAAGCAVASKFARILPRHKIAVVEPKLQHLYQPGLTLAAVGLMDQRSLVRSENSVLPRGVHWLQSGVAKFQPALNQLRLADADNTKVSYDFLVIATGIELRFDLIDGLPRNRKSVLELPGICSIYFPEGAAKTQAMIGAFQTGQTALFTFPNWPIKCPGAPQKILYLAEERFREREVRRGSQVLYATALGRVFGVQKWSDALLPMVQRRGIKLETRLNLCRVDPAERVATFQVLDEENKPTGEHKQFQYDLLHIGAPCSPVAPLREHAKASVTGEEENDSKQLTDAAGFIRVDPNTLQSLAHGNVFAIGDCANTPNAKTAAAVSSQLKTLSRNLRSVMAHQSPTAFYDGYASCPLVVGRRQAMLAEFNPQGPMETFPFWQTKPTLFVYWLKRYVMPPLYWRFLLRGRWQGPAMIRRFFHPFRTIRTYWSGGREALEKGVGCGQS